MNDHQPKRIAIISALIVAILAGSLYLFAKPKPATPVPAAYPAEPAATSTAPPPIVTWSPPAITIYLLPGDIRKRTVNLATSIALQNVSLTVAPEIAPFVTLTPSVIASSSQNQSQHVQILAAMPVNASSSSYDGTIRLTAANKTIPQTLKVIVTVGLPLDPGPAGTATLAGIDSDRDGVRDDVQRYIGLTYPQSAKKRAALTQAAIAMQDELSGGTSGTQEVIQSLDCISYTFMTSNADVAGGQEAHDAFRSIEAVVLNTPDRAKASVEAESRSSPSVQFSTPFSQRVSQCKANPSSFAN